MKLRNKKTGEIIELLAKPSFVKRVNDYLQSEVNTFNSLAELNEEWEDYEEPKEYYFINSVGGVIRPSDTDDWEQEDAAHHKQIGNYFETKEEAEKAVEKLKAWKRLKDKGYYFSGWRKDKLHFEIELRVKEYDFVTDELKQDLDLLFGGEE